MILIDEMAAVFSSSRPQIQNVICRPHDFSIVFYHEHGVSDVPETQQNLNEPLRSRGWRPMDGSSST
jgi:hypothetical protein